MEQISICITTYNRSETTIKSFEQVLDDERVGEIVIVDDCSDTGFYTSLKFMIDRINNGKIKLHRNEVNLDCYKNKRESVSKATNENVLILDSDNVISKSYLDVLYEYRFWETKKTIWQPSFARPHFNFSELPCNTFSLATLTVDKVNNGTFQTMLNAMNYVCNRDEYLKAFNKDIDPITSDSFYQNLQMLKNGNTIFVVPGMEYDHPISHDSHYKTNVKRTPQGFHESLLQELRDLVDDHGIKRYRGDIHNDNYGRGWE